MNALIPIAKADAGELSRQRFLRANGPVLCQPRATPWVSRREQPSPDGAAQAPRPDLVRPYRAQLERNRKPRAMPWAVIVRTVGAKDAERSDFLIYLYATLNGPSYPVRHRRHRLTAASPDDWKKLPIPDVSAAQQQPIVDLVEQILTLKRANPAADIRGLETQIDDAVASLYGRTPEEIAIVEGSAK